MTVVSPNGTTSTQNPDGSFTLAAPTAPPVASTTPVATPSPLTSVTPPVASTTTIDASKIGTAPSVTLPPAPTDGAPGLTNTLSSIPSISSIVGQESVETPAEKTNDTLDTQLLNAEGQDAGKGAAQTAAESAAGLPALNSQLTDLNSQITALKNEASVIPLQDQQDAEGRGETVGGLAPIDTGKLRQNTIKALGLSSLASALQGNIATAQAQADAAVKAQFDPIEAQITYLQQAIQLNAPNMTKEEKTQADTVQAQLTDRQNQINDQKADMSTAQAWAAAAVKNNPGDPAAQHAAQQVLGLDFTQPGALQQALTLVGKYQSDPTATAQAAANLASTRADVAYKNAQTSALAAAGDGGTLAQSNLKTTSDGKQYIDGSSLTGKNEQSAQTAAAAAGIPYVSAADSAVLDNIGAAQTNLAGIQAALVNVSPSNALSRLFEIPNYAAEGLTQSGPEATDISSFASWKTSLITAVKGIAGPGAASRNATLVTQMMEAIPSETDTKAVAAQKLTTLNRLLTTAQTSILGTQPTPGTTLMTGPDGNQYNVPNAQVAAFKAAGGHQ